MFPRMSRVSSDSTPHCPSYMHRTLNQLRILLKVLIVSLPGLTPDASTTLYPASSHGSRQARLVVTLSVIPYAADVNVNTSDTPAS